jgi:hypothetical protein
MACLGLHPAGLFQTGHQSLQPACPGRYLYQPGSRSARTDRSRGDCEKFGSKVTTSAFPFHENDRAIAEGKTLGECKLVLHKGKLVGASIVGEGAGDILQLVSVAMSNGLKLTALTNFISPYPTRAEVVKRAASAHFTPVVFGTNARRLVGLLQRIP